MSLNGFAYGVPFAFTSSVSFPPFACFVFLPVSPETNITNSVSVDICAWKYISSSRLSYHLQTFDIIFLPPLPSCLHVYVPEVESQSTGLFSTCSLFTTFLVSFSISFPTLPPFPLRFALLPQSFVSHSETRTCNEMIMILMFPCCHFLWWWWCSPFIFLSDKQKRTTHEYLWTTFTETNSTLTIF